MTEDRVASAPDGFDDDVARLLRWVGPRPAVPAEVAARVHAAVHARWRAQIQEARRRRFLGAGLLATAGLAAALLIVVARRSAPVAAPAGPPLAVLERAVGGGVRRAEAGRPPVPLAPGDSVPAGAWIETAAEGGAAWRIGGGLSLRLAASTRVQLLASRAVWLDRGAVYLDSGAVVPSVPFEIRTALGVVRDVGTQFEVRAAPGRLQVRVREGRVALMHGGGRHEASAGSGFEASREGLVAHEVAVFGPDWAWVEEAAPAFPLEGQSLEAVIRWASRETGWRIRFAREADARSAARVIVHGSAADLTPSQALEAVLPTCGLRLRREGGSAWIEPAWRRSERP